MAGDKPRPADARSDEASDDRRAWPHAERRETALNWLTPVSIDGQPPIQRRRRHETGPAEPYSLPAVDGRVLVFPGQGAQAVGMGRELADAFTPAREVFAEVDDALSQPLFRLMTEGPEEDLRLTENTQPALMAVSIAIMRVVEAESGRAIPEMARLVAGHSLGEFTALTAAGSLGLADAVRLVRARGQAMQRAVPVGEGAMAAVMGLDLEAAAEVGAAATDHGRDGVCVTANDNAPGQVVVSGTRAAVERALGLAAERGAKRHVLLPVSAPFHSPLMAPAAEAVRGALDGIALGAPAVPLVSNVTAGEESDPERIRALLVEHVTAPVRWRESVVSMRRSGIETMIEVGFGRILSGLVKRIDRDMSAVAIETPQEIARLVAAI